MNNFYEKEVSSSENDFGELIRATGPMAKTNPFRFSTKYQDDETDLVYYGYRYYNASTGRCLSRDPLEEEGGLNLYEFASNSPLSGFDPLGLLAISVEVIKGSWLTRGTWGQPAEYASGSSQEYDSGAETLVNLEEPPQGHNPPNSCNTVAALNFDWLSNNEADHAGSIKAFVSDLCPGKYEVEMQYTVHLWMEGTTSGEVKAYLYGPDMKQYHTLWKGVATKSTQAWALHEVKNILIDVNSKNK